MTNLSVTSTTRGAAEIMFKFSLIDESRSDSQGQGNIHHYGFQRIKSFSQKIFFPIYREFGTITQSHL